MAIELSIQLPLIFVISNNIIASNLIIIR